ncbi:MAG: hypothetical protein KJ732_03285 [Candidatus Margulisbacteria bacterium]|nr:hypothetical protein [Candidatus Margulisiibacteriota bacterium]
MINKVSQRSLIHPYGQVQRTRYKVLQDFRARNCLPARDNLFASDLDRATRLSPKKYQRLAEILQFAAKGRPAKVRVYLPLLDLEKVPLEDIPLAEFRTYVRVLKLDLRPILRIRARFRERNREQEIYPKSLPAAALIENQQTAATEITKETPPAQRVREKYLPETRLIRLRRVDDEGHRIRLTLELIRNPYSRLSEQSDEIVADLFRAFANAWEAVVGRELEEGFYKNYIREKYWKKAEKLAILRRAGSNEILGFAAMTREEINGEPLFCLAGTVLHPVVQGLRLSVKLNQMLVVEAWRQNAHLIGGKLPLVVRTASPRVLGSLGPLENLFPNPLVPEAKPEPERIALLADLAARWTPGLEFDSRFSVSRAALTKGVGGLIYEEGQVQHYRDRRVNDFCRENLDYEAGDLFMISGDFSRRTIFKMFLKKIFRTTGSWWRRQFINVHRWLTQIF